MFLVELIASSFFYLISKQARRECRCKRVLVHEGITKEFMPSGHWFGYRISITVIVWKFLQELLFLSEAVQNTLLGVLSNIQTLLHLGGGLNELDGPSFFSTYLSVSGYWMKHSVQRLILYITHEKKDLFLVYFTTLLHLWPKLISKMCDGVGSQMRQRKDPELFGLNRNSSEKPPHLCTDVAKYYLTSSGLRALWNTLLLWKEDNYFKCHGTHKQWILNKSVSFCTIYTTYVKVTWRHKVSNERCKNGCHFIHTILLMFE